jgi:predicted GNAT family N-acyltransferase
MRNILEQGDTLPLQLVDQRMKLPGEEYAKIVKQIMPKGKIMMITGYDDYEASIKALNAGVDLYLRKPLDPEVIIKHTKKLLQLFKQEQEKSLILGDGIIIKVAETQYEREEWFKERYRTYVEEIGHLEPEDLSEEQNRLKQEWDDYDFLPSTTHIVVMKYGEGPGYCIGGARLMRGTVALEEGVSLDAFREAGITPVEASRFMLTKKARGHKTLLLELMRFCVNYHRNDGYMFCTSQTGLYQKLGFVHLNDSPILEGKNLFFDSSKYRLRGEWRPYVLSHDDIFRVFGQGVDNISQEDARRYSNFAPLMYNAVVRIILDPEHKLELGKQVRDLYKRYKYFERRQKEK